MPSRCLFVVFAILGTGLSLAADPYPAAGMQTAPAAGMQTAPSATMKAFETTSKKADAAVLIPFKADTRVGWLINDLETIDGKLTVLLKSPKRNLSDAQVKALFDARNLAVLQVDESLKDPTIYSLSASQERKLKGWIGTIDDGMTKVSLGPRDQVKAVISYAGMEPRAIAMHYRSYAQRQANDENWSTYTVPKTMKVGTYEFRVSSTRPDSKAKPCLENVLIFNDPTEQGICGGYRP